MKHEVSLRVEEHKQHQRLTPNGAILTTTTQVGINITVRNLSSKAIGSVHVVLSQPVNVSGRQWNGDNQNPYTFEVRGHYITVATLTQIPAGEVRSIFHVPEVRSYPSDVFMLKSIKRRSYGNDLHSLKVSVAHGAYEDGEAFEQWHKSPHTMEVKTVVRDAKCFIATEVYGDPLHPVLHELRFARDEILARNIAGRRFIKWYYERGPRLAEVVATRPALKRAARCLLTPTAALIRAARNLSR
jgi:hypothetical protein